MWSHDGDICCIFNHLTSTPLEHESHFEVSCVQWSASTTANSFLAEFSHRDEDVSTWCGWHRDIGSLTGLTCAMYTKGGVEVPSPDSEAGLYIRNREGKVVKAVYNADYLAFQMGETTEILSGGLFHATPHCVKAPRQEILGVERNSFAVFMQPQWDEPLSVAQFTGESSNKLEEEYSNLSNFGDFSEFKLLKYNYDSSQTVEVGT